MVGGDLVNFFGVLADHTSGLSQLGMKLCVELVRFIPTLVLSGLSVLRGFLHAYAFLSQHVCDSPGRKATLLLGLMQQHLMFSRSFGPKHILVHRDRGMRELLHPLFYLSFLVFEEMLVRAHLHSVIEVGTSHSAS